MNFDKFITAVDRKGGAKKIRCIISTSRFGVWVGIFCCW